MDVFRSLAATPAVPWTNGAGLTTEFVSFEESRAIGDESLPNWRLSVAALREPAPFSPLPGVQRTFMPLDGDVTLRVGVTVHRLASGAKVHFPGDADVELLSLDHSCHALNLMVEGMTAEQVSMQSPSLTGTVGRVLAALVLPNTETVAVRDLVVVTRNLPARILKSEAGAEAKLFAAVVTNQ